MLISISQTESERVFARVSFLRIFFPYMPYMEKVEKVYRSIYRHIVSSSRGDSSANTFQKVLRRFEAQKLCVESKWKNSHTNEHSRLHKDTHTHISHTNY